MLFYKECKEDQRCTKAINYISQVSSSKLSRFIRLHSFMVRCCLGVGRTLPYFFTFLPPYFKIGSRFSCSTLLTDVRNTKVISQRSRRRPEGAQRQWITVQKFPVQSCPGSSFPGPLLPWHWQNTSLFPYFFTSLPLYLFTSLLQNQFPFQVFRVIDELLGYQNYFTKRAKKTQRSTKIKLMILVRSSFFFSSYSPTHFIQNSSSLHVLFTYFP